MRKKIELRKGKTSKTFQQGYDEFILNCKIRNLRPATIKHYDGIVYNILYKYLDPEMLISEIDINTVHGFIIFCKEKETQNDVTVNTNLRALRAICYYFMKLGYMKKFHIAEIKVNQEIIETYTDSELNLLLKKPDLKKCSFVEYRNWVIVNFLMATGCRAGTLVNIKFADLDFDNNLITYKHTKNRKQQLVPMSNSLKKILIEYLQFRGEGEYLFVNAYGGKMTQDLLSHNLNSYNKRKGVMKTGVHRYRHTFSKKWILNGGDIFRLQKILGHSTLDVVKNYVNMFTNDLQKDFNTFNPLETIKQEKTYIKLRK